MTKKKVDKCISYILIVGHEANNGERNEARSAEISDICEFF